MTGDKAVAKKMGEQKRSFARTLARTSAGLIALRQGSGTSQPRNPPTRREAVYFWILKIVDISWGGSSKEWQGHALGDVEFQRELQVETRDDKGGEHDFP